MEADEIIYEAGAYFVRHEVTRGAYTVVQRTNCGLEVPHKSYWHDQEGKELATYRCKSLALRDARDARRA